MATTTCPDCGHLITDHSNLAGCIASGGCRCQTRRRSLDRLADDAATVEALERVERGTDPAWASAAEAVVAARARTGEPFTTDDVWFDLAAQGVEAPREPRALGPIVKRALLDRSIRQEGYATSRRRHQAIIRSYVGTPA